MTGSPFIEFLELKEVSHNGMHQYLVSSGENSFQREFFNFLRKAEKESEVARYSLPLEQGSQQEAKDKREALKIEALKRNKERSLYSNTIFSKIRSNLCDGSEPYKAV